VTDGLLVMAYGTPASRDDVAAYYTDIRRGRPPTDEQLADLLRRYDAIGGVSPLRSRTEAQVACIASELGDGWHVALGYKHSAPFVEDAAATLADRDRVVGLVLAPHYSALSVGEYLERAAKVLPSLVPVRSWHLANGYVEALTVRVRGGLASMPPGTEVVFTAHSLPARIADIGDPYADEITQTALVVAERAGVQRWSTAWQSAGRTPEPWLGPDILDVIRAKSDNGVPGVLVCPCGFVSDHLEVLYDLDIDAARVASECGIAFARTRSLNDDPAMCRALADVVRRAAATAR
jgi:ferrochelatase